MKNKISFIVMILLFIFGFLMIIPKNDYLRVYGGVMLGYALAGLLSRMNLKIDKKSLLGTILKYDK
jgi:hypothetical protein